MNPSPGGEAGREPGASGAAFEEEFAVAERAVDSLERGDLTLEEALRRYEQGLRALGNCYAILERTRQRIEVLAGEVGCVADGDGGPVWKPAAGLAPLREALDTVLRARGTQAVFDAPGRAPPAEGPL